MNAKDAVIKIKEAREGRLIAESASRDRDVIEYAKMPEQLKNVLNKELELKFEKWLADAIMGRNNGEPLIISVHDAYKRKESIANGEQLMSEFWRGRQGNTEMMARLHSLADDVFPNVGKEFVAKRCAAGYKARIEGKNKAVVVIVEIPE